MVHAHTLTSTFFHLASLVLLVLTTFSAPFISSIFFLERAPGSTRYGAFGTCQGPGGCSKATLGWEGGDEFRMWMVRSLILWGIGESSQLSRSTLEGGWHLGTGRKEGNELETDLETCLVFFRPRSCCVLPHRFPPHPSCLGSPLCSS